MSKASKDKNINPYLVTKRSCIVCRNDFESTVAYLRISYPELPLQSL